MVRVLYGVYAASEEESELSMNLITTIIVLITFHHYLPVAHLLECLVFSCLEIYTQP